MEVDLSPKLSKELYGGDGGSSYACPSDLPMLHKALDCINRMAVFDIIKLPIEYLFLPYYAGSGVASIVLPEAEKERLISIKTGDAIALPFGVVSWLYNEDDTELIVLFLGETSKAHKVGEFTNFSLIGSNIIFTGFSTEFVGRAWDLEEDKVKALVASQACSGIVKLHGGIKMPEPNKTERDGMALNCLEALLDVDIKNGGTSLNSRVILVGTSLNSRFALVE